MLSLSLTSMKSDRFSVFTLRDLLRRSFYNYICACYTMVCHVTSGALFFEC